jgi:hypothetical protein
MRSRDSALRASRSSLAITSTAFIAWQAPSACAGTGRSSRVPLSTIQRITPEVGVEAGVLAPFIACYRVSTQKQGVLAARNDSYPMLPLVAIMAGPICC